MSNRFKRVTNEKLKNIRNDISNVLRHNTLEEQVLGRFMFIPEETRIIIQSSSLG
jgi:hypothetical protein